MRDMAFSKYHKTCILWGFCTYVCLNFHSEFKNMPKVMLTISPNYLSSGMHLSSNKLEIVLLISIVCASAYQKFEDVF